MPQGEPNGKPIIKILPFCPRATAEGMAGPLSALQRRVAGLETEERVLWICGASFAKTSAAFICRGVPQTERKGRKDRRASARRAGLRIPGPVQKAGMVNVHLVVHKHRLNGRALEFPVKKYRFDSGMHAKECTASGTKINLLFCNMNTYESRKPT